MSAYVSTKSRMSVQIVAKISIPGALAFLVMMLEIPLPFAPDFYKLGFDKAIILIGGFTPGPWAAVYIEALKVVLSLLIGGTITTGVKGLTNFLVGLSFILPATIIHQKDKTRKHALLGLIAGMTCMTILGGLLNYFVILPTYSYLMNLPLNRIIEFGHVVNPSINRLLALVLTTTTPFNVLRGVLCNIVVFLSYKKVSPVIKK